MARMKLMRRFCYAMPVSCFWCLQTRLFRGDCAIPVGRAPEPEPTPFVGIGLPFFAVNDGNEFPLETTMSLPGQLAYHIRGRGEVRHGSSGGKRMMLRVSIRPNRTCVGRY